MINESDRFATFQIELKAEGAESESGFRWYRLSPEVGAKKPPGDRTQFSVAITDNPIPGFVGTMNLLVSVFSLELNQEERQIIRLVVEPGMASVPVQIKLPIQDFQVYPGDSVIIPARVLNPSHLTTDVLLQVTGMPPTWLVDGAEQPLQLKPGGEAEVMFRCQPATTPEVRSQVYPFTLEAKQRNSPSAQAGGRLTVLPSGYVEFSCTPQQQQIPIPADQAKQDLPPDTAAYQLTFENVSNLPQQVGVKIQGSDQKHCTLQVMPEQASLNPGETAILNLLVTKKRPPLGLPQRLQFEVAAVTSDERADIRNDDQMLELRVQPRLPVWAQALAAVVLLALLGWLFSHRTQGHTAPVNSVRFSGDATQVISGASDQTVRRWRVNNDRLEPSGILAKTDNKAVRTIRYKPIHNNLVAAGLENGEIQLWQVRPGGVTTPSKTPFKTLSYQKADRVLSLAFSKDSNYLFSGHGSGLVLQWEIDQAGASSESPINEKQLNFAISDLALLGGEKTLAIAGRYNRLVLWNWMNKQLYSLAYPQGDQNNYILSLATADNRPQLLATADNQGSITTWNLAQCLNKATKGCEKRLDQWNRGHNGKPVRSLAFSADGCYLASTGDDGRAVLWALTGAGKRHPDLAKGREMGRVSTKLNSVGLTSNEGEIRVVSGGDDNQVRLYRVQTSRSNCQADGYQG